MKKKSEKFWGSEILSLVRLAIPGDLCRVIEGLTARHNRNIACS